MNDQIFYSVKSKVFAFSVFISILLIFGGGYNLFLAKKQESIYTILGVFALIAGVIFLTFNLWQIIKGTKEGLYLNTKGITIKSSFVTHFIEWQNIKSFTSHDILKQAMIAINLFDNDKFLRSKKGFIKWMGRVALKKYGTPISIAITMYNVSKTELLSELNYALEKWRKP